MLYHSNSSTIYVSQATGDDHNTGFSVRSDVYGAGPIKSFKRAMNIVYRMRVAGNDQPLSVKIIGDYYLDAPIKPAEDREKVSYSNMKALKNVTFESFGKDMSRIIGGRRLTGFKKDSINGVECLSLFIPEVKDGTWRFTDLYVNGKRADLARYPKDRTLKAKATEFSYGSIGETSKWFIADKADLEGIDGVEDAIVSYYHYWIDAHSPIASYDKESGRIDMALRSRFNITVDYEKNKTSNFYYYLENIAQSMTEPNEWYLDVAKGVLYYIPEESDVSPDDLEVFAPTQEFFAEVKGTAQDKAIGVRFKNLEFICSKGDYQSKLINVEPISVSGESEEGFASDPQAVSGAGGGIRFEHAEDCGLFNCKMSCIGIHAVEIGFGCTGVRVENCRLEELGGGGIKIFGAPYGYDDSLSVKSCIIRGCLIKNCGKRYAAACGILACDTSHNEISDNEICYTDYTGISVGWVWGYNHSASYGNLIRNNHIHHIGMGRLSDMGGIYLLGPQNGTVIEGNHIHDVNSAHYGGWGIYADEGSSNLTIEKNVVYRCKSNCFHQHYGACNVIRGNVFAFAGDGLVKYSQNEHHTGIILEDNVFITDGKPIYDSPYPSRFAAISANSNKIMDTESDEPNIIVIKGKDGTPDTALKLADWQRVYGIDENTVVSIPEFLEIDAKNKNVIIK